MFSEIYKNKSLNFVICGCMVWQVESLLGMIPNMKVVQR